MSANRRKALHRKAVHRRRRAGVLALLALVAAVIALLVWRPWADGADSQAVEPPATSAPATPTPTPTPTPTQQFTPYGSQAPTGETANGACGAEQVVITPNTDAATYQAGQQVQMSFQIENIGDEPCTLNVGTTQQAYEIRTGNQVVFRSSDCPVAPVDQMVELQPGVPQSTIPIPWDRTYSTPETCTSPRDQVVAGGASYHLSIAVSGYESEATRQFILY